MAMFSAHYSYSRPNPYILLPYFYYYGRHIKKEDTLNG